MWLTHLLEYVGFRCLIEPTRPKHGIVHPRRERSVRGP